ncbi:Asp-tRNA(Asn)/Glu-tRNA(Gln) amidotransferase subunit GatC [bacterium]|jgi:aspartyl-tRNA(Asn)/glutamyl-tRNA(Gln) amidotransferase subunit C|nr:Asp-tRNA(Asn)/Glu-tRNA(Gln) amidotransferase subunit GatC [bacterium]MBT5014846.1 Asp-tRNA(Asn)/Glu-tRNA(Gln) amidotransferase subunit GatC [bacterium]
MRITREEVLKIASISKIEIQPDEIEEVLSHLQSVLDYAARVSEVAANIYEPSNKNLNIVREDVVSKTDVEPILSQAPEREGNFFEVPSILKNN